MPYPVPTPPDPSTSRYDKQWSFITVHVSDYAWQEVTSKAKRTGHIRQDTMAIGISHYLECLLATNIHNDDWMDNRPQQFRDLDIPFRREGKPALWFATDLGERIPHGLSLPLTFQQQAFAVLAYFGITGAAPRGKGHSRAIMQESRGSRVGAFIEVLGQESLLAKNPPHEPKYFTSHRKPNRAQLARDMQYGPG